MSTETTVNLKAEILDTATRLFFTEGYRVGVDQIIKEAGVAKMTYYKYFPAKTQLLSAVIERVYQKIDRRLRKIAADESQSASAQAYQVLQFLFSSMADPAFQGRLIPQALLEMDEVMDDARQTARDCMKRIRDTIIAACRKAGIPPQPAALQLQIAITGGAFLQEGLADEAVGQALNGLLTKLLRPAPEQTNGRNSSPFF